MAMKNTVTHTMMRYELQRKDMVTMRLLTPMVWAKGLWILKGILAKFSQKQLSQRPNRDPGSDSDSASPMKPIPGRAAGPWADP